jgi:hypothetical protein
MQQDLPFEGEESSAEESSLFEDGEGDSELHIVEHGEDA